MLINFNKRDTFFENVNEDEGDSLNTVVGNEEKKPPENVGNDTSSTEEVFSAIKIFLQNCFNDTLKETDTFDVFYKKFTNRLKNTNNTDVESQFRTIYDNIKNISSNLYNKLNLESLKKKILNKITECLKNAFNFDEKGIDNVHKDIETLIDDFVDKMFNRIRTKFNKKFFNNERFIDDLEALEKSIKNSKEKPLYSSVTVNCMVSIMFDGRYVQREIKGDLSPKSSNSIIALFSKIWFHNFFREDYLDDKYAETYKNTMSDNVNSENYKKNLVIFKDNYRGLDSEIFIKVSETVKNLINDPRNSRTAFVEPTIYDRIFKYFDTIKDKKYNTFNNLLWYIRNDSRKMFEDLHKKVLDKFNTFLSELTFKGSDSIENCSEDVFIFLLQRYYNKLENSDITYSDNFLLSYIAYALYIVFSKKGVKKTQESGVVSTEVDEPFVVESDNIIEKINKDNIKRIDSFIDQDYVFKFIDKFSNVDMLSSSEDTFKKHIINNIKYKYLGGDSKFLEDVLDLLKNYCEEYNKLVKSYEDYLNNLLNVFDKCFDDFDGILYYNPTTHSIDRKLMTAMKDMKALGNM